MYSYGLIQEKRAEIKEVENETKRGKKIAPEIEGSNVYTGKVLLPLIVCRVDRIWLAISIARHKRKVHRVQNAVEDHIDHKDDKSNNIQYL